MPPGHRMELPFTCTLTPEPPSCEGPGRNHWSHLTGEETEAQRGLGLVQGHIPRGAEPGLSATSSAQLQPEAEHVGDPVKQVVGYLVS